MDFLEGIYTTLTNTRNTISLEPDFFLQNQTLCWNAIDSSNKESGGLRDYHYDGVCLKSPEGGKWWEVITQDWYGG